MIKKLFPVLLALVGIGGGVGAGIMLKPAPVEVVEIHPCGDLETADKAHGAPTDHGIDIATEALEYIKLNNQFVVPIVHDQRVTAMVVMSISVEVTPEASDTVYAREPKLRDGFLQVLFDHANMGGFDGEFTSANNMDVLRMSLGEVAKRVVGGAANSVLITEIARQDV
ncbi:MAG: flagellar basal body-associated protein FliL [Roseovarius sp.]|nr:flagellar basal body-associated protein FliL [Roseovarius sp.]